MIDNPTSRALQLIWKIAKWILAVTIIVALIAGAVWGIVAVFGNSSELSTKEKIFYAGVFQGCGAFLTYMSNYTGLPLPPQAEAEAVCLERTEHAIEIDLYAQTFGE